MKHRAVFLAATVLCLLSARVAFAQTAQPSLRWLVTVDKSLGTETAGEYRLFGAQQELHVGLSVTNFSGSRIVGMEQLASGIGFRVDRDGQTLSTNTENVSFEPVGQFTLAEGESVRLKCTIRRSDGLPFGVGTYAVVFDLSDFLVSLRSDDAQPWIGNAKRVDVRRIIVQEVLSNDDRINFLSLEGNYHLGAGNPQEAIRFLEPLIRLTPNAWQPHAALGAAYFREKRYEESAQVLERALPTWMEFSERRGDLVPNTLASAYLALGREADARRTLRTAGLPDSAISERVDRLRSNIGRAQKF